MPSEDVKVYLGPYVPDGYAIPFQGDLRLTPGVHNTQNWSIREDYAGVEVVALHEEIHDQILTETAYGFIQHLLMGYQQTCVEGGLRIRARSLHGKLFEFSKRSHEIAATYLAIKKLPPAVHHKVLEAHSIAYQNHFKTLSSVIDTGLKSSYLQYLLAWTLIRAVFNGPTLLDLPYLLASGGAFLDGADCPDSRLDALISRLDDRRIQSLVGKLTSISNRLLSSLGMEIGFDPQEEDMWKKIGPIGYTLESVLAPYLDGWIKENLAGDDIEILCDDQMQPALERAIKEAEDRGVLIFYASDLFFNEFFDESIDTLERRRIFFIAQSCIQNKPIANWDTIQRLSENDFWVDPSGFKEAAVITRELTLIPSDDVEWVGVFYWPGSGVKGVLVSGTQLRRFLRNRVESIRATGRYYDHQCYVIGLPAPIVKESLGRNAELIKYTAEMFRIDMPQLEGYSPEDVTSQTNPGLDRVVFYMHGNLMAWIGHFMQCENVKYEIIMMRDHSAPINLAYDGLAELDDDPSRHRSPCIPR